MKTELLRRLEHDGLQICARFRLQYRVLEAERANVKRRYGVCYSDGTIRIRLRHATSGNPLKYSSLVNTLCHELAHLRHFNHGSQFQILYGEILEWARREKIYQPGRADVVGKADVQQTVAGTLPGKRTVQVRTKAEVAARTPEPSQSGQLELFG